MYGMYAALPPDPLPPGPRVRNPAAPLLRLLLRAFNVVLAAVSLLLIGAALWMAEEYKKGGSGGGSQPPSASPAAAGAKQAAGGSGALRFVAQWAGAAPAAPLLATWLQAQMASHPWFLYLVGGTGAYCLCTALIGLAGVKRDRRLHLGAYIALLALLLAAQAGATLLLLTDNSWRERIPDDPSGRWAQLRAWVEANGRAARLAAIGALFAELAALAAACWLQAIYQSAYDAWLDDREEASERLRAAAARTVVQTYAGGSGSPWAARLRCKYGVDASELEATSSAARQMAALQNDAV